MTRSCIIVLLIATVFSCSNKKDIPSGILPPKQMQSVIWDLMRADQFLGNYILNKDTSINRITESLKYYQRIFTLHKISREDFQKSFIYYRSNPVLFKQIMDSIGAPALSPAAGGAPLKVPLN